MNRATRRLPSWTRRALLALCVAGCAAAAAAQEIPAQPGEPTDRGVERKMERKKKKHEKQEQITLDKARSQRGMPQDVPGLFAKAQEHLRKKQWIAAREALLVLEDNADALSIQADVKLAIADSYYGEGDILSLVEATTRYRNFLTYYPSHPRSDYAQFQIGNCYDLQKAKSDRDQSQTRNALFEYQKFLELYPGSSFAPDAQERIRIGRNRLADHEVSIGRYYYVRKQWDAAAGRLRTVVADYPEYEGKAVVYSMLAQSFYNMGSTAEGDVYRRLYEQSGGGQGKNFDVPRAKAGGASRKDTKGEKKAEKAAREEEKRMEEEARKKEKDLEKQQREQEKQEKQQEKKEKQEPQKGS